MICWTPGSVQFVIQLWANNQLRFAPRDPLIERGNLIFKVTALSNLRVGTITERFVA